MLYDIAIIGGGVAGCSVAYHARQHGLSVVMIEAGQGLASAASGNPVGLIKPVLDINDSLLFQFYKNAFEFFLEIWPQLNLQPLFQGIVQLPLNETDAKREKKRALAPHLPTGWAEWQSAAQLSERLGTKCLTEGAWFPEMLAIDPIAYCQALAGDTPLLTNVHVVNWEKDGDNWSVILAQHAGIASETVKAKNVIVCAGAEVLGLPALQNLPIRPKRGQLTYLPATTNLIIQQPVNFGHYLAPAINGQIILGATYEPCEWDTKISVRETDHQRNLNAYIQLQKILPELPSILPDNLTGRVAIRATTAQHLPIYGAIPNQPNAYYLTGLGSRGLMTAPYVVNELFKSIGSAAVAR